jgi:hypothetical protein
MAAALLHSQDPAAGLHQMLELAQELLGTWGAPTASLHYPASLVILLQQLASLGKWMMQLP